MSAHVLIREARRAAGLTQAELAARMGVQQPVVARLERGKSDPRFSTVVRALQSAGHGVYVRGNPAASVDEAQIAANLRRTPAERMRAFEQGYAALHELTARARRLDR